MCSFGLGKEKDLNTYERAFPAARPADKGDEGAGRDVEINAAEDLLCRTGGIGEAYVLELELVCARRWCVVFIRSCFCDDGLQLFQPGDVVAGRGSFGDTYGVLVSMRVWNQDSAGSLVEYMKNCPAP